MNAPHPAVLFIESRVLDFFRFIAERHLMFVRRVIYHQPPPWTQDPILARTYTTNVYRELDRGTRYLIRNILPHASAAPMDTFWNVLVYRMFNWAATYEALGGFQPASAWNPALVVEELERRHATEKVFTGATRVSQRGREYDGLGWSKIQVVVDKLTQIHTDLVSLFSDLQAKLSLRDAHWLITCLPGFGGESGFLAYEVVSDLVYHPALLGRFSEDDWVNVGPGAKAALRQIVGGPHRDDTLFSRAVHLLRRDQEAWFRAAGVVLSGPELTSRNIEHSLCETQKVWHTQVSGRPKRAFTKPNDDLSPWDDIPARFQQQRFPIRTVVNQSPEVPRRLLARDGQSLGA